MTPQRPPGVVREDGTFHGSSPDSLNALPSPFAEAARQRIAADMAPLVARVAAEADTGPARGEFAKAQRVDRLVGGVAVERHMWQLLDQGAGECLALEPQPYIGPTPRPAHADVEALSKLASSRSSLTNFITVTGVPLWERLDQQIVRAEVAAGGIYRHAAVPFRLQIIDRKVAYFPLHPLDTGAGAYVTENADLVRLAMNIFDGVWRNGSATQLERPLSATAEQVLHLLVDGYTDETIARELRCSVRTVARHIADMQAQLSAKGRFQLAVRAQRAGWL